MKKILFILFVGVQFILSAQSIDYNLDKGYMAEGYDIVSYFNNNAKEGSSKYEAIYNNVKFKFSSQENLNLFNSEPQKYLPQYGGYCAYALAVKAKKIDIDPETFEIRNGKLFLFYNSWGSNALESWLSESPHDLKSKADKNWETLKFDK
jgi:YHS domain-containing protein